MIIIVAPSASGKDTIMNKIVELTNLKPVISYSTRPIRINEVDGIAYNFISEDEFKDMKAKDLFIETSNYNSWNYGMAKIDCGDDRIVIVDPCGFRHLKRVLKKVISFFIDVPERVRLLRLVNRGDDISELTRRIISDRDTFRDVQFETDFTVKNEDVYMAATDIVYKLKGVI